jgi:hypothetical protein
MEYVTMDEFNRDVNPNSTMKGSLIKGNLSASM